jgi:Arc/MetJ-type ribon-helix-helix transcriptional regulator
MMIFTIYLDKRRQPMTRSEFIRARISEAEAKWVDEIQEKMALSGRSEVVRYCIRAVAGQLGLVIIKEQTEEKSTGQK